MFFNLIQVHLYTPMKKNSTRQNILSGGSVRLFLSLVFACFLSGNLAFAQSKTVTGKVLAADGSGIPGVNILVKGTSTGTNTNVDGGYSISVPDNATLVFSFVGYTTQEVAVGNQTALNITLAEDTKALEEVVVTALGIKKEARTIGYSTQDIKGEELIKAREPNPVNSLAGKIAGLTVGASSEMLGKPSLILRGNQDLLLVVDGVPINSDTWNVSADDIETYTVLKGPNAAALYGFRGQNGAIMITTKKGSKDKRGFSVDFNSSTMAETGFLVLPQKQHEYGYGANYQYAYSNDPYDAGGKFHRPNEWGPRFEGQGVAQYDSPIGADGNRTKTPWVARGANNFKEFMQAGLLSNNNISIGTSGEKYDLRMSLSHSYQKGIAPNTRLQVTNLNLSGSYSFLPRLKLETNVNVNLQYTPNIPEISSGPEGYIYSFLVYGSDSWSVSDMRDYYKAPLGKPGVQQYFAEYGRENNPYFIAYEWLHGHNKTDIYGYAKLTYKINDYLNISGRSQITTWNQLRTEKLPYSTITYKNPDLRRGDYREDRRILFENNTDLLLSFDKNLTPSFHLTALAGGNLRTFKYNSSLNSTDFLIVPGIYSFTNSLNPVKGYTFRSDMMVLSAYASADLTFKNFVTLSGTVREDKSSTLSKSYVYPSASVSTVVSDYIKMPEVVSFFKLRASYANVKGGNTSPSIGTAYRAVTGSDLSSLIGYGSEVTTSYDGPSYRNQNTYSLNTPYNNTTSANFSSVLTDPGLKPFTVSSYEAGIDLKFFGNRLGLDATYFETINGPLIFDLGVATSTAYTKRLVNAVTTHKKGWELTLKGSVLQNSNGLNWDVLANWSTYKETLKEIGLGLDEIYIPASDHNFKVGDRMDGYYGYKFVRDQDGNVVHDKNGLPLYPTSGPSNKQLIGNTNPDYVWAINNRFSYKGISLSFQFDGRVGGIIYDQVNAYAQNAGNQIETTTGALGDARLQEWNGFNKTGTITSFYVDPGVVLSPTSKPIVLVNGQISNFSEGLTFVTNTAPTRVQTYVQSNYNYLDEPFMISKTFAKLREVTIGYTIPSSFFGHGFIKKASISLIGRNLLYFAKVKDFDVDSYPQGLGVSSSGVNLLQNPSLQTPSTRRFGVNFNITF